MKLSTKLALALGTVLAAVLAAANTWTLERQFSADLSAAQAEATRAWTLAARTVQREGADRSLFNVLITLQADGAAPPLAAWKPDGSLLYIALPAALDTGSCEAALNAEGEPRTLAARGVDGQVYLLTAGTVITPAGGLTLLTAQGLGEVWAARRQAGAQALFSGLILLVLADGAVVLLCRRLTRPLGVLEAASRQIAAGAYDRRTALATGDEMEALSASFDAMAAAVQEKIAALEAGVRQREDFVAAFTHELKTPMTSMLGYADLLRGAELPAETRRLAARYIYHESARLEALSDKLLALLRLTDAPPALCPTSLGALLRRLSHTLPPPGPDTPAVTLDPADGLWVQADGDLLEDLLYNLILNACAATPAEGRVTLTAAPAEAGVTLAVQDTGCGIPPEDLPRLCEPFYMVDKSRARRHGGSGLGLALCAKIAELHGTTLQFESEAGHGTVVKITLAAASPEKES